MTQKHTSRSAQNYFEESGIYWWKTPASSTDLNPIENVWGSMKNHLRKERQAEEHSGTEGWDSRLLANIDPTSV